MVIFDPKGDVLGGFHKRLHKISPEPVQETKPFSLNSFSNLDLLPFGW